MLAYLHIPFCHRVCPYCSFYKHTPGSHSIPAFLDALLSEANHFIPLHPPRTLYLGGGTPSMLSPTHLRQLFHGLSSVLDFAALDEITLEANPATFDLEKARLFRDLGVTRVSLGIQSFHPETLQRLGREHTPEQASEAVKILRRADIPSINIDLMFSVPGLALDDWRATLETAIALQPNHISAYNLTYEEDTEFFDLLQRHQLDLNEDRDASQFFLADDLLTAAGFTHYETSNYAQAGHESSHNHGYWQGEDYLGLGPSAVSTIDHTRCRNVADTHQYLDMIRRVGHARTEEEQLTADDLQLERLALMLRTREGIPQDWLDREKIDLLIEHNLAHLKNKRLILTRHGSALVDPIVTEIA